MTPLLTEFLTPDLIAKMASRAGISDVASVQKTISGAVPAILSGLANLASKPDGARQLSSVIASQPSNLLDNLTGMSDGPGQLVKRGARAPEPRAKQQSLRLRVRAAAATKARAGSIPRNLCRVADEQGMIPPQWHVRARLRGWLGSNSG